VARRSEIDVRLQALQLGQETDRLWAQLNFLFPQYGHTQPLRSRANKDF
jgi:hypothetical protein